MRIYRMTATFGKLEHQTLTLQPGLNIIEAPNEWGKSTWCAFLAAMLYGIDTRAHSTKTALADKDRYTPWSGNPMAGSMDICWQGRDITIERRSRGRAVFGEFKAYETASGLPVPELTAANCGQLLLGVERSVFLRSCFLRLADLPVTPDEALRRRLNALVTTGDESVDADELMGKLRELKNRIRFNRTGLLPQAEAEEAELTGKLNELRSLRARSRQIGTRLDFLSQQEAALDNHLDALRYAAAQEHRQRMAQAEADVSGAKNRLDAARQACRDLPSEEDCREKLNRLKHLQWQAVELQAQPVPQPPRMPENFDAFRGMEGYQAEAAARYDALRFRKAKGIALPLSLLLAGLAALIAGIVLLTASCSAGWIPAAAGAGCLGSGILIRVLRRRTVRTLTGKYGSGNPGQWKADAKAYAAAMLHYDEALADHLAQEADRAARQKALTEALRQATGGEAPEACMARLQQQLDAYSTLALREKEYEFALCRARDLHDSQKPANPPGAADELTFSQEDTLRILSDIRREQQALQLQLGQVTGRMDQLGSEEELNRRLMQVQHRIAELEDTYSALVLAQQTLMDARSELQRRFAPRITRQARELFGELTEGRYHRLTLDEAMHLQTASDAEDTLRHAMWRSDGTMDQMYLALRLAVARELTPLAPLVLDDALVRFDDARLRAAMHVLRQEARSRQVLLFTCQSRERNA